MKTAHKPRDSTIHNPLALLASQHWAMTRAGFAQVVSRPLAFTPDDDALALERPSSAVIGAEGSPVGVAIVTLHGVVYTHAPEWAEDYGYISPQRKAAVIRALSLDPSVSEILLDWFSPGGTASGTEELAVAVRDAAALKPVTSIANDLMCSAAYWAGSQASRVVLTRTACVGSIGVITSHADYSKYLEEMGIDLETYRTGDRKALGQMTDPNDDAMRSDTMEELGALLGVFLADVAPKRGLTVAQLSEVAGSGRTWTGQQAVDAGLADGISTLEAEISRAVLELGTQNSARTRPKGGAKVKVLVKVKGVEREIDLEEGQESEALSGFLESVSAEAQQHAVSTIRAELTRAMNVPEGQSLEAYAAVLTQQAGDGRAYRADLLERLGAAVVRTHSGDNTSAGIAAERVKKAFENVSISDLSAHVQDLEGQVSVPGRKSVDTLENEPKTAATKKPVNWSEL